MILFKRSFIYLGVACFCFLALIIAWIAEISFGIKPCQLCLYLRYIIISILFLSLVVYVYSARWIKILNLLCIASAFSLSFYHMGVEQHWWKGPAFCAGGSSNVNGLTKLSADEKLEQLRKKVLSTPIVRCDQINWRILDVSTTIWSTLLFAILLVSLGKLEWTKKTFIK